MTRDDLIDVEREIMKLVVKTRQLGGYDTHAENEMIVSEVLLRVVQHLLETFPRSKH